MKQDLMKDNVYMQLVGELYRAYNFFNDHFKLGLDKVILVVGPVESQTKNGHFSHDIWENPKGGMMHEILMAAQALSRGPTASLVTLVHEMAHFKNFKKHDCKVVDCKDQRHNKIFRAQAEALHLKVTSSQRYGSGHTETTPEFNKLVEKFKPNEEVFKLFRKHYNDVKKQKEKTGKELKPVMVGQETKNLILQGSKAMGMSQKEFTTGAVKMFAAMPKKIKEVAHYITRHQFKDEAELMEYLVKAFDVPQPKAAKKEVTK